MAEKKYEFRRRLEVVHQPNRRDHEAIVLENEIAIDQDWSIAISEEATPLMMNVAKDLQDYFLMSMNISVRLLIVKNVLDYSQSREKTIALGTKEELPAVGQLLSKARSYRVVVSDKRIIVCGNDERGVGQGSYFLEDLMNLREAPFLTIQEVVREPIFSPRMAHSGWGLTDIPMHI